jgi:hypothetical protein
MSGFNDYQKLMLEWAKRILEPHMDTIMAGKPFENSQEQLMDIIFHGFIDISDTYEALILSETLISVAPPRSKKIEHDKYIKYVVNTYLQDVYILKERLNSYATKIMRIHNNSGRNKLTEQHIKPLFEIVKNKFQGIVNVRGGHVHAERYCDSELRHASIMSLASNNLSDFKSEYPEYSDSLVKAKVIWYERMKNNNIETKKVLDLYFKSLILVVQNGNSVYTP